MSCVDTRTRFNDDVNELMEGILGDKYEHDLDEEDHGRAPDYPLEDDHGLGRQGVHVMDEEEEEHWREMEKGFFDEADLNKDGELDLREYAKALFKDAHVRTTKPGTGNETGSSVGNVEEVEKQQMETMVFRCALCVSVSFVFAEEAVSRG